MYESAWIELYFSFVHSCVRGTDDVKHENEIDLFDEIDENVSSSPWTNHSIITIFFFLLKKAYLRFLPSQESKHKRTDRAVFCYLKKGQPGKAWPRLTEDKVKVSQTLATRSTESLLCGEIKYARPWCDEQVFIFHSWLGWRPTSTTGKTGRMTLTRRWGSLISYQM